MGQALQATNNFGGDYIYEQYIGEGAFGKVYKIRLTGTNHACALKVINCESNEDLEDVVGEMKTLSKLSHPNIVKLIETRCLQKESFKAELYLVFEYCSGGTLNRRLCCGSSNKSVNLKWMCQMASAISYLHSNNLVHRDLKPDNILLSSSDDIKVADFGLSRNFVTMKGPLATWESYYMESECGSFYYMAPEIFDDHYTEKADVFSLGSLLYAIEERSYIVVNEMKHY